MIDSQVLIFNYCLLSVAVIKIHLIYNINIKIIFCIC